MPRVIAIAAMDRKRVIGFQNRLPWNIPEDLKRFSALTKGKAVLMGRKTYESLPPKFKPLPGRRNIVVTGSRIQVPEGVEICSSLLECLKDYKDGKCEAAGPELWIIGGGQIYSQSRPFWDEVCLTLVEGEHRGDAFFPHFEDEYTLREQEPHPGFEFRRYLRSC